MFCLRASANASAEKKRDSNARQARLSVREHDGLWESSVGLGLFQEKSSIKGNTI